MDPVRLGVIGAGFIGRVHMETFAQLEAARVVGCTDVSPALAASAVDRFGLERTFAVRPSSSSRTRLTPLSLRSRISFTLRSRWHCHGCSPDALASGA
ncbi:MAG: hypothetical protein KAU31_17750, partial [Spirochaetaceae bacterium]|nr:hypothetical protein [Spirochaetaceae bacterium]